MALRYTRRRPDRPLDVALRAAYVHLQAGELAQLTGAGGLVQEINLLREASRSSVIVTPAGGTLRHSTCPCTAI